MYFTHHFQKSIVERAVEYVKDSRTGYFDDYYPCRKSIVVDCILIDVYQWMMTLFTFLYNLSKSGSELNILKFLISGGKVP
jgi:hypothetical protein